MGLQFKKRKLDFISNPNLHLDSLLIGEVERELSQLLAARR
jgi:hypothetical protein